VAPHREAEVEELHRSEGRLQAVIQSAPVGILEVDLHSRVIRWNPAAEQIFGWAPEEILGHAVPIVPPSKQAEFEDVLATVRSGRQYPTVETYRQRKDGSLVDVELSAAPVRDSAGRVVSHMAVFTDITKRKRQERELHASRARIVQAADTERRRLERNLHDGAQQRLVGIALLLRLAAAAMAEDPPGARRALDQGQEELALALGELRELARGLHPAVLTSGGLGVALESLADRAPVPVAVTGVPQDRLPEAVEAATYYLVAEALTNVAKYASASEARVHVELREASAVIEVSDDGVGGADAAAGTGLRGLADRVEALGGSLDVRSPLGGGTMLRAAIPCRPAQGEQLDAREPSAVNAADNVFAAVKGRVVERSGGGDMPLRVVVAEDALLLRAGVVRVLEDASFEVVGQAGNADELMREVRAHRPDLAVTDIRMPPTYTDEGLQAARLIRAELPGTGVLLLSQYAEETYALELLGDSPAGVGYLLKDRVSEPRAFADTVRDVGRGGSVIDPAVIVAVLGGRPTDLQLDQLSFGEREVMSSLAQGRSNDEIAQELAVTEPEVERHVKSILQKLGLSPLDDERRRTLARRLFAHM
jgi:PAS domain S-box-containing protein